MRGVLSVKYRSLLAYTRGQIAEMQGGSRIKNKKQPTIHHLVITLRCSDVMDKRQREDG